MRRPSCPWHLILTVTTTLLTFHPPTAHSLSFNSQTKSKSPTTTKTKAHTNPPPQQSFTVNFRQEGEYSQQDRWTSPSSSSKDGSNNNNSNNFLSTLESLWNDQRSITTLLSDTIGRPKDNDKTNENDLQLLPYCIESSDIQIKDETFRVLVYPRGIAGRFDSPAASAYLRYYPSKIGQEVDAAWTLRLVNNTTKQPLRVSTSGGLPLSTNTWTSAMTFCGPGEDVESVGRASDWGASTWSAEEVGGCCTTLDGLVAEVNVTVFELREGESSFSWPLGERGALGAVRKAMRDAVISSGGRTFRAGEVIVPTAPPSLDGGTKDKLEACGVLPGVDYRIMTLADKDGTPIFTTSSLPEKERGEAKLALRPVGWKRQASMWKRRGISKWPVEVDASLLSQSALSRFNTGSFIPRLIASLKLDAIPLIFACLVALTPLPLTVFAREYASFYAIPSSSMDPTLQKGDVLLVEKLPGVFDRTRRGDVVLFRPPSALDQIIGNSGGKTAKSNNIIIGGQSPLFVKRVVGMPGDEQIIMNDQTEEVTIHGQAAVGPNRNLCEDEPLKLIDRLLENGKGRDVPFLGENDVYVLGDCKVLSVDSRVWGTLPKENIVGRPVARIWPLQRFSSGPF